MGINEDLLKSIRKNIRQLKKAIQVERDQQRVMHLKQSLSVAKKQEKEAKELV